MSFSRSLLARGPSTPLSRYTAWNGALYLALGASLFALPQLAQRLFLAAPFQGREEGLVRVLGFAVAVIGYFYVFGARTGADSFGLSTVIDRLLVPVFLTPLALTGAVDGALVWPLVVLDPLLGLGAFLVWRRQQGVKPPS